MARGNLFTLSTVITGVTVAAGHVAPPGAAAATTLTLLNPSTSTMNFEIVKVFVSQLTGTPATGAWAYCMANSAASVSAVANVTAAPLYSGNQVSVAKGYSNTALTGGPVHTQNGLIPAAVFAGALTAASNFVDTPNREIVVAPGWMLTIAPPGAGTSLVVVAQIIYAEVPA
jgi:hypothetical protein